MYEIVKCLCAEKGMTISQLCREFTGSDANLATWKKNNFKRETILKIADYFNVSTDFLFGRTKEKGININSNNNVNGNNINIGDNNNLSTTLTIREAVLIEIYRNLDDKSQNKLLHFATELEYDE